MDVFELLTKDHRAVDEIFEKIDGAGKNAVKTKQGLFEKLQQELELHTQIEEKIFYPEMKKLPKVSDMIGEAVEEHREVKQILRALAKLSPEQQEWAEKIKELQAAVQHHVKEEEREMFPAARKELDQQRAEDIGRRLQQMKQKASA